MDPIDLAHTAPPRKWGYVKDTPDVRDHLLSAPAPSARVPLPPSIDLRPFLPPVYDQGNIGSCTANAIAAAIDFERRRAGKSYLYPSRLFIYYNERKAEGDVGEDGGAQLRDGIKSVAKLGVCPEFEWPYGTGALWGVEPPVDCYTNARLYRTLQYSRVSQDLYYFRHCLGILQRPIVFGFDVYPQFESNQCEKDGVLWMPKAGERSIGGHAVLACGYDDAEEMVLVRNSWGSGWGIQGYFKMPYQYFLNPALCSDFWTILAEE